MLNLDETLAFNSDYINQRDFYLKGFLYFIGVFIFVEILRSQVSEINLLQLVPGFYLVLLFSSLILLLLASDFLFRFPLEVDNRKEFGTKMSHKIQIMILLRLSFFFLLSISFIGLNTIIPLSLDSFNSFGENALENTWSFDEVINLEAILFLFLIALSQFPILGISYLTTEKDANHLPVFWKAVVIISIVFAGIITPTIDGFTQFSFAFSTISLYLLIINIIEKRISIRFIGLNSLTS